MMQSFAQFLDEGIKFKLIRGKDMDVLKMWNKGDNKWVELRDELVKKLIKLDSVVYAIVDFMEEMIAAKTLIVNKLNSIKQMTDIFVRTDNGYKVTNPEGYVAIDHTGTNAVKLVDRMEFSYNNFTAAKAWDK